MQLLEALDLHHRPEEPLMHLRVFLLQWEVKRDNLRNLGGEGEISDAGLVAKHVCSLAVGLEPDLLDQDKAAS